MHKHANSIWYLIGLQLVIYGLLITGAGVWELFKPPAHPADLAYLHPAIWWGAMMFVLGLYYVRRFRPSKTNAA